jgi:hypothetical protein
MLFWLLYLVVHRLVELASELATNATSRSWSSGTLAA